MNSLLWEYIVDFIILLTSVRKAKLYSRKHTLILETGMLTLQEHLRPSDLSFVFRLQVRMITPRLSLLLFQTFYYIITFSIWMSHFFRLQVADNSTLYGCCLLVEEIVNKPSRLLSTILDKPPACSSLSRYVMTTRRCYCILTRLPFFELHFGVLNRCVWTRSSVTET